MLQRVPFEAFVLTLESSNRFLIEHPENLAFVPAATNNPSDDKLWILTQQVRVGTTLEAVTSVGLWDSGRIDE
jgi:hypothetical protein